MVAVSATIVEKRNALAYVEAVLDTHRRGGVVLPLDPGADAVPVGIDAVDRIAVAAGGGWFSQAVAPRHDDAPAQISLTSGTTGLPKAILLSHRALGDVTERLIAVTGIDASIREYVGVPVTFSFGFGRVRAIAAMGGAAFLPERGFRVDELAAMLERGEVNALSAVPTLLRVALAQGGRLQDAGRALRWLEIGSQAMSADEKRAVRELFPNARIVQHYGLTEASRSTFLDVTNASDAELAGVGRPNGSVEVRIDDSGRIGMRGRHVADGMVTADGVVPLTDADGWLLTNDLGRLTEAGLLFEGRADHLINVGGVKVPAEQFEERLLARLGPAVSLAVAGGSDPLRGELVVVAHPVDEAPEAVSRLQAAAAAVAAEMGIGDGVALLPVDVIPRTETNKVRRGEITAAFAAVAPRMVMEPAPGEAPSGVGDTFAAVFGSRARDEGASFHSLGGDSLHYVTMLTGLERAIPRLPDDWDMQSIGALTALAAEQTSTGVEAASARQVPRNLDTVRGLACVLIVALHVVGLTPGDGLRLPEGSPWRGIMDVLGIIRLPLFTAMSGYLYAALPATRFGFGDFMGRKLRQLLVPLIFATLAFWTLRGLTYGFKDSLVWAFVDGYQHLWFIDALLLIFALVSFVDTRTRSPLIPWLAILAAVALGWWALPSVPILHIKNALFLLPFFIVGLLLYRRPVLLESSATGIAAVVLAVGLLCVLEVPALAAATGGDRSGILRWVCGSAWVVTLLRFFPKFLPLERIAAYSFTIYLWHPAANGVVRNILWKSGLHATPMLLVVGLVVGVGLPIALHLIMLRLPRIFSMPLIGR